MAEDSGCRKTNINLASAGGDQLIVLPMPAVLLNIQMSSACASTSQPSLWYQSLQTRVTKTRVGWEWKPRGKRGGSEELLWKLAMKNTTSEYPIGTLSAGCVSAWLENKPASKHWCILHPFSKIYVRSWHTLLKVICVRLHIVNALGKDSLFLVQEGAKLFLLSRYLCRLSRKNLNSSLSTSEIPTWELLVSAAPFLQFCSAL